MDMNRMRRLFNIAEYRDILFGIISFIFFGIAIIQSFYFKNAIIPGGSTSGGIGASFYPRLFCGLACMLSIVLIVSNAMKLKAQKKEMSQTKEEEEAAPAETGRWGLVGISMSLTVALVFLILKLGVVVGGSLYAFPQIILLTRPENRSVKFFIIALVVSISVPVLIFCVFRYLFGVSLPMGIFK